MDQCVVVAAAGGAGLNPFTYCYIYRDSRLIWVDDLLGRKVEKPVPLHESVFDFLGCLVSWIFVDVSDHVNIY